MKLSWFLVTLVLSVGLTLGQDTTQDPSSCRTSAFVQIEDKCVQFAPFRSSTWDEASYFCSEFGGQLLAIEDFYFYKAILRYLEDNDIEDRSYWTGGSDRILDGAWRYTNGAVVPMGSPFWATKAIDSTYVQEPSDGGNIGFDCLQLDGTRFLYFDDADCSEEKAILCEEM